MMSVSQAGDILYLEAIDSSLRMCLSDVGVSEAKSKYAKRETQMSSVLFWYSTPICFIFHTNRATEKRAYENLIYLSFPCCTVQYIVNIYVSDG